MRPYFLFVLTALSVSACAAEPARNPAVAATPAVEPTLFDDSKPASIPSLTIERNGEQIVSLTVYDPTGKPFAVLYPSGGVDVKQGTPQEAAKAFFGTLTKILLTQCTKPEPTAPPK